MTALSVRQRVGMARMPPLWFWPLAAVVAGWSVLVTLAQLAYIILPQRPLMIFLMPLTLGIVALVSAEEVRPFLARLFGFALIVAIFLFAVALEESQPMLIYAVPGVAVSAWLWARKPEAGFIAVFFLTGTFASLEIFTPVPVGESVDLVLGGLWGAAVWAYVMSRRERPLWLWVGAGASFGYILLTLIQALASDSLQAALYSFRVSTWYMAAFLLVAYGGWGDERIRRVVRGVAAVGLIVGSYAVFRWIVGPADQELQQASRSAGRYNYVGGGTLRLLGSFPSGHHLASWMAVVAPFSLALALALRDRWRLVAAGGFGLCVAALLASQVRAGLAGTVIACGLVLVLYQLARGFPGPHLGITGAAVVLAVGVGVMSYSLAADSQETRERYANLLSPGNDPAVQRRFDKWEEALRGLRDHPLGFGLGTSGEAEKRYSRFTTISSYQLDNSYLHIATQQGLGMAAVFLVCGLLVLLGLIQRGLVTSRRESAGVAIGAAGTLTSFLVLLISGLYIEGLPALAAWIIVGLGVAQFTAPPGTGRPAITR